MRYWYLSWRPIQLLNWKFQLTFQLTFCSIVGYPVVLAKLYWKVYWNFNWSIELTPSTDKQSRQDNDPNFEHELERQAEQNGREKTPDQLESGQRESKQLPKLVYMGIIFIMVIISTVVISANGKLVYQPYRVGFLVSRKILLCFPRELWWPAFAVR